MQYAYRNITTTDPVVLIRPSQSRSGVTTIHKCQIANVDSATAVVDIYIEKFDLDKTVKVHGKLENGNMNVQGQYKDKEDRDVFYQIKNVNIPAGVTLSLFTDHACRHGSEFQFVIESTQNVDVILDYEQSRVRSTGSNRSINQY